MRVRRLRSVEGVGVVLYAMTLCCEACGELFVSNVIWGASRRKAIDPWRATARMIARCACGRDLCPAKEKRSSLQGRVSGE
jgi:hypothetical protein